MNQSQLSSNEFAENRRGLYSSKQIRSLLLWFLWEGIIFGVAGLSIAYGLQGIYRNGLLAVTCLYVLSKLYLYGMDLVVGIPMVTQGRVTKQLRKYKGPAHYDVIVADNLRIRALNKIKWLTIDDNEEYVLYYTRMTKWLLSYEKQIS